jgi:hypothetical protein
LQELLEEAKAAAEATNRKAAEDLSTAKRELLESKQKAHASNQVQRGPSRKYSLSKIVWLFYVV